MSAVAEADEVKVPKDDAPGRVYGFSVLLTGLARIGRQPLAFLLIVVINALIQGLLTHWTPLTGSSGFYISAFLSFVSLVLSFGLICRLALATVDGKIKLGEAITSTGSRFGLFLVWVVIELVAIYILTLLYFWPGLIFMLIVPFVALAAMDGRRNALKSNFIAIKQRFGRYLVTMVFWVLIIFVSDILLAMGSITLSPAIVAIAGWLYKGFIGVWLTCAFAALYRSTREGRKQEIANGV